MANIDTLSGSRLSARRYTAVAIVLHWTIALAIFFQLVGGKWMVSAGASATGSVFTVFQIHKTVGLTILALTLARLVWRLANPAPPLPEGMNAFERVAASLTHVGFYLLLVALPLSGWAMASVSPTGVPTFFLLLESLPFAHVPLLGEAGLTERHNAEAFLKTVHEYLSFAMAGLILLHIAAALKHQFIARDNLMARMIVSARTVPNSVGKMSTGLVATLAALAFLGGGIGWGLMQKAGPAVATQAQTSSQTPAIEQSGDWVIDHDVSSLGFTITYTGNTVEGRVGSWSADVSFDPDALETSSVEVSIDMASVNLGDATLQAQAAGGDGFDLSNYPLATYRADRFTRNDDGTYTANGVLELRGVAVDTVLQFTFQDEQGVASVQGSTRLNRLDFGVGAVGAADESWIVYGVDVAFNLTASRAN